MTKVEILNKTIAILKNEENTNKYLTITECLNELFKALEISDNQDNKTIVEALNSIKLNHTHDWQEIVDSTETVGSAGVCYTTTEECSLCHETKTVEHEHDMQSSPLPDGYVYEYCSKCGYENEYKLTDVPQQEQMSVVEQNVVTNQETSTDTTDTN